jgi:hypothetical protein
MSWCGVALRGVDEEVVLLHRREAAAGGGHDELTAPLCAEQFRGPRRVYGWFAAAVRPEVISRPKIVAWMRRSFAATYVILAGRLAAQTR